MAYVARLVPPCINSIENPWGDLCPCVSVDKTTDCVCESVGDTVVEAPC